MELAFGGAVVIDTDGPFIEVHPEEDFRIVAALVLRQVVRPLLRVE